MYHIDTNNPSSSVFELKADSGATCHYLKKERSSYLNIFIKLYHDQKSTLPNNSSIQAIHSGLLLLGDILSTHTQTHMFFQNYLMNPYFLYDNFLMIIILEFLQKILYIFYRKIYKCYKITVILVIDYGMLNYLLQLHHQCTT